MWVFILENIVSNKLERDGIWEKAKEKLFYKENIENKKHKTTR